MSQSSSIASSSTDNVNKQRKGLPFSLGAFGVDDSSQPIQFGTGSEEGSPRIILLSFLCIEPDPSISNEGTQKVPVMNYYVSTRILSDQ